LSMAKRTSKREPCNQGDDQMFEHGITLRL
jgi:hypothetical protein